MLTYTSYPPATPPSVGNAGFGLAASTTRSVVPSQLGAVQRWMLVPNPVIAPGTRARPLLPTNEITGMSTFAACVRFSMSRRPRPTESAVESRLIVSEHCPSASDCEKFVPPQGAPIVPTGNGPVQVPPAGFEQCPGTPVTERPELG